LPGDYVCIVIRSSGRVGWFVGIGEQVNLQAMGRPWTIGQATEQPMGQPFGIMGPPSDRFDLGSFVFAKV
jgi:hypothetical protein